MCVAEINEAIDQRDTYAEARETVPTTWKYKQVKEKKTKNKNIITDNILNDKRRNLKQNYENRFFVIFNNH